LEYLIDLILSRSSEEGALAECDLEQVVGGAMSTFRFMMGKVYDWLGGGSGGDSGDGGGGGIRG
jgi:hypothetical protein